MKNITLSRVKLAAMSILKAIAALTAVLAMTALLSTDAVISSALVLALSISASRVLAAMARTVRASSAHTGAVKASVPAYEPNLAAA